MRNKRLSNKITLIEKKSLKGYLNTSKVDCIPKAKKL